MRFLIDEDFDNRIFRGLLRAEPLLDIIRVQDTVINYFTSLELHLGATHMPDQSVWLAALEIA
jgi:hypothetical protein